MAEGEIVERPDVRQLKAQALNEFARGLSEATTLEEARGLALIAMRGLLDIIYPDAPPSPPLHDRR